MHVSVCSRPVLDRPDLHRRGPPPSRWYGEPSPQTADEQYPSSDSRLTAVRIW